MGANNGIRYKITKEVVETFHHLPARTIAKYLLAQYGDLFENDIEKARSSVRYIIGSMGEEKYEKLNDKSLIRKPGDIIKLPKTWIRHKKPFILEPGLWLILSDVHVPFHEPKPLESAIKKGQAENVDGIFINGDLQDCASVGFWPSTRKRDFNAEVEASIQTLDFIRQEFPDKKIIYKPGNHEYRLPRLFASKAPELIETPLVAWETIMGFEERGIEFLDFFQVVNAGKLPILHGHEIRNLSKAINPARGLFLKAKTFSACAHCHSTSQHSTRTLKGELITTWSFGCLCDLEPEYNPFGNDWNWGFGLVSIEKSGHFEVVNLRVLPSGKVV